MIGQGQHIRKYRVTFGDGSGSVTVTRLELASLLLRLHGRGLVVDRDYRIGLVGDGRRGERGPLHDGQLWFSRVLA